MAEIQISELRKSFSDFVAVKRSSMVLQDGKFVVLLGPSGCGKTTTLRMIAGLEYPTSGQIMLDGTDVTYLRPRERDIAMVFQLFALYPHMGVRDNLEFPLRNEGLPRAEIDRRVREGCGLQRGILSCVRPAPRRPGGGPSPARRARAGHRAPAQGLPDGRAAGHARRGIPRDHVPGTAQAARG